MKTERSQTQKSTPARKEDEARAGQKKERDPEAFERLLDRAGKRKSTGGKREAAQTNAPAGEFADVGDEASWRGRVVEGEAQMAQREERRGHVRSKRSSDQNDQATQMRARRSDEGDRELARDIQKQDRTQRDVRDGSGAGSAKTADSDAQRSEGGVLAGRANDGDAPQASLEGAARIEARDPVAGRAAGVDETSRGRRAEVAEIADKIVESARAGFDAEGRTLLTMTMDIPGRGRLEIRLRKHGRKMQVELAADSPAFGRLLRRSRKDLKQQTRQRGVHLASVRVAR